MAECDGATTQLFEPHASPCPRHVRLGSPARPTAGMPLAMRASERPGVSRAAGSRSRGRGAVAAPVRRPRRAAAGASVGHDHRPRPGRWPANSCRSGRGSTQPGIGQHPEDLGVQLPPRPQAWSFAQVRVSNGVQGSGRRPARPLPGPGQRPATTNGRPSRVRMALEEGVDAVGVGLEDGAGLIREAARSRSAARAPVDRPGERRVATCALAEQLGQAARSPIRRQISICQMRSTRGPSPGVEQVVGGVGAMCVTPLTSRLIVASAARPGRGSSPLSGADPEP